MPVSNVAAHHNRIVQFWQYTQSFWQNPNSEEETQKYIKFMNTMIACLSVHVTDEEWKQALQSGRDSLRIHAKGGK